MVIVRCMPHIQCVVLCLPGPAQKKPRLDPPVEQLQKKVEVELKIRDEQMETVQVELKRKDEQIRDLTRKLEEKDEHQRK